jgi:Fur family zinc uptake transcriptional regulator
MTTPAFAQHDHGACVAGALAAAEAACAGGRASLTPVRRRALEILLEGHAAMGAYDLLARLSAEGLGSQPPVAYRALNFLVAQGLAHRIESADAFVACAHPGRAHVPAFLVCRRCRAVAEGEAEPMGAEVAGFAVERRVVEAEGLCPGCRDGS